MQLHIIRHGETRHNAEKRIQGDLLDDPLNEVGLAQAHALARHYARRVRDGLRISAIYTSPLVRARTTATIVAEALSLREPMALHGLREISWGHLMGKLNAGPTRVSMERVLHAWAEGNLAARVLGGESPPEAWARAMADLAPTLAKHGDDEAIVLVAHGRLNKILLSDLLHGHLHFMERYPQANTGVTVLDGPAPWRILTPHSTSHLATLRALDERA